MTEARSPEAKEAAKAAAKEAAKEAAKAGRSSRRRFVLAGAGALGVAAAGTGLWAWRRFAVLEGGARRLAWLVARRTGPWGLGLDVSDALIVDWVRDEVRLRGAPGPKLSRLSRSRLERFLLSTDLLAEGRAPGPLRYLGPYDPHKNPCVRPFPVRAPGSAS